MQPWFYHLFVILTPRRRACLVEPKPTNTSLSQGHCKTIRISHRVHLPLYISFQLSHPIRRHHRQQVLPHLQSHQLLELPFHQLCPLPLQYHPNFLPDLHPNFHLNFHRLDTLQHFRQRPLPLREWWALSILLSHY
jgi:hypothetical protein